MAQLRLLIHSALKPSAQVEDIAASMHEAMEDFARRKKMPNPRSFVGVQLPTGIGWAEFCRQEMLSAMMSGSAGGGDGVEAEDRALVDARAAAERQACDMGAAGVVDVLERRRVGSDVSRLLFVATGVLNTTDLKHFFTGSYAVMSRARFDLEMSPDLAPAVDMALCRRAAHFVGNFYSSFSYVLREARLAAGESTNATYFNLHRDATAADLTLEEAQRWDVFPLMDK